MRIVSSGLTDVGMKRQENEDSFACDDALGLYVVADGMGGHAAGEVASRTAIEAILKEVTQRRQDQQEPDREDDPSATDPGPDAKQHFFEYSVQLANRRIVELSRQNPIYNGMGTTVSGMLVTGDKATIAHVGDSRVYRLRDGQFMTLTDDHSWVNEQVQRNIITEEEARTHRWRNVITRALGNKLELEVDTAECELRPGDLYVLCSDGLTGEVTDPDIKAILLETDGDPAAAARRLVDLANERGGQDNITVIVLSVEAD